MSMICHGNGDCLTQTTNCNTYGKAPGWSCTYNCTPLPCPNVSVCGTWIPKWILELKRSGVCISCDSQFHKKLDTVETTDCPVCLETKPGVVMPKCTHSMCVDCFKRCMYGAPDEPEPQFPYPEDIHDEWEMSVRDDPTWHARYPLAKKWDKAWNKWNEQTETKYSKEKNLRKCPYCRS